MNYEVKYVCEVKEHPHCGQDNQDQWCNHIETTQYQSSNLSTCLSLAKDILDVPFAELTLQQVQKDFSSTSSDQPEDEKKMIAIRDFYNGRLALWNRIQSDVNEQSIQKQKSFKYDIPEKYNSFCTDEDRESNQIQSYIEVKTT